MPLDETKLGELIGTVTGQTKAIDSLQKSMETNRNEVIAIFREMRDGVKDLATSTKAASEKLADSMAIHIKEDNRNSQRIKINWRISLGSYNYSCRTFCRIFCPSYKIDLL